MDPNDPFTLILQATIGGVVETVAGKAMEGAPRLVQRAKALLSMVERQPISASEQAVVAAVEAARQDLIAAYRERDLTLSDAANRDIVALLNHPPFAEEVANALLFRGQPDLNRLRRHYLERGDAATSARWQELEEPLLDFFAAVESHLLADPNLGPMLRETAQLASLIRLEDGTQLIAEYSRQALNVQTRIAANTEQSAQTLHSLLLEVGGGNAHLGQIVGLLAAILERLPAGEGARQSPLHGVLISAEELAYLRKVHSDCDRLPLANIPSDQPQPRLQRVFVELRTTLPPTAEQVGQRLKLDSKKLRVLQQRLAGRQQASGKRSATAAPEESMAPADLRPLDGEELGKLAESLGVEAGELAAALRNLTPLEFLSAAHQRHSPPHLVILGNPGGGKSTLLGRLTSILAAQQLPEPQAAWEQDQQSWAQAVGQLFGRWLLPVRVSFHRWDRFAQQPTGCAKDLIDECVRVLQEVSGSGDESLRRQLIARLGAAAPSALLLLDGLDEVADSARRDLLLNAVRDFCQSQPDVPVLITCRVKPYEQLQNRGKALLQKDANIHLDLLDAAAIDQFVTRWHAELLRARFYSPEKAADAEAHLRRALADRPKLQEMAGTPLLLTMMARVNYDHGLPESRAELYDSLVRELLWEWEKHRADDRSDIPLEQVLTKANLGQAQLEQAIDRLAYDIHGQSRSQSAVSIPRERLESAFKALLPGDHTDPEVAGNAAKLAAAILQVIGRRTGLVLEMDEGQTYQFTHHTLQEYLAARWIATGNLGPRKRKFAERVDDEYWREAIHLALGCMASSVNKAYDEALSVVQALLPRSVSNERERRRVLLLGEAFAQQFSAEKLSLAVDDDDALRTELPLLLRDRLTTMMQDRTVTALQRLEAGLLAADIAPPPAELAGDPVLAPITGLRDKSRLYDFQIGQYPITNAQYRRFVDAGGYDKSQSWWTPKAIKEIEQFTNVWPAAPRYWDDGDFNHGTQPVVGVSWYEAMAYCAWLSEEWGRQDILDKRKYVVRLPTEAEWQWAAAGPAKRSYAWGEQFDAWRTNSTESNLNRTTPVHMYPDGATPPGAWAEQVWDLCGNVWEWCLDDAEFGKRLRGGAYWYDKNGVGTAARLWYGPRLWDHYWGIRVVVVPISR